ncbi:MAG: tryptophan 7-halogenase [Capsulimonadales bacterium]|nr:tryptophan 7-halogenase [Capsulimonadales bacterium]
MTPEYDLAVVGSGFGGSLLAMIARRLGRTVLLLEKGKHPRFAIGESTSPLANLLIEEMAHRYDLPNLLPLTSFGPWQRTFPEIVCGLKRGFTYYGQTANEAYRDSADRTRQLLVAASPNDELADTHWLRSDVDAFLLREAVAAGADYRDEAHVEPPTRDGRGAWLLRWRTGGGGAETGARARLIVDATGPRGWLSRAFDIPEKPFCDYPGTQAMFGHFRGVARCDEMPEYATPGETPPYPPDDAALHHVFDGGWMWVLRFGNGVTSAGFALRDDLADRLGLRDGEAGWQRLMERFPTVGAQFARIEPLFPLIYQPRLSYRAAGAAGDGWALLPSAAAFIDPLFSTGIPLTLLGIERLARILEAETSGKNLAGLLTEYGATTLAEVDATADFIGGCYAAMHRFPLFAAYSRFYFAAASFSEMTRRLGKRVPVGRFLASDHPTFGAALREGSRWLRQHGRTADESERAAFDRWVNQSVDVLNIAGLCAPGKRNWYGVDLADVVTGAHKLGFTPEEMRAVLADAPWTGGGPLPAGP